MFILFQIPTFGEYKMSTDVNDLSVCNILLFIPLIFLTLVIGIYPNIIHKFFSGYSEFITTYVSTISLYK